MVKARKYVYVKHFNGFPKEDDLELVEEELPPLKDDEYLVEAVYLSLDPYLRSSAFKLSLGTTYIAFQVAKVVQSKSAQHPVGQHVVGNLGWRTHTICNPKTQVTPLPNYGGLPLSLALGVLGVSGLTAYFGFLEICQPQPGETVVVTGAAGAVGSVVGQIAKIKGCTVVGVAGSDEKGKWLVDDLGFDKFVNYKDADFVTKLAEATPKGVDCFFDNVGGEVCSNVMYRMNLRGRVALCGAVSCYNDVTPSKVTNFNAPLIWNEVKVEGFIVSRWSARFGEGVQGMVRWIKEGKLKYRETVTEGFENMFKAFVDMLNGGNTGKTVVKV